MRPPAIAACRSPCRDATAGARSATRASTTQPTPPAVEEILAVMRAVGDRPEAHRLRALGACSYPFAKSQLMTTTGASTTSV
jgi:hypothetical protein